MFVLASGVVSWLSKSQIVVALSTTEAEYMVATQACKKAIWIHRLMEQIVHKQKKNPIYCDSEGARHIARNPVFILGYST